MSVAFFGFAFSINDEPFFTLQPALNTTFWPPAPPIPTARLDKNSVGNVYDNTGTSQGAQKLFFLNSNS